MRPAGPIAVTFDVNVLVRAVATGNSMFTHWPSPPPVSARPEADCVGIINDAEEFALWVSPHILENTVIALVGAPPNGYGWSMQRAQEYIAALLELASASGGGHLSPAIH